MPISAHPSILTQFGHIHYHSSSPIPSHAIPPPPNSTRAEELIEHASTLSSAGAKFAFSARNTSISDVERATFRGDFVTALGELDAAIRNGGGPFIAGEKVSLVDAVYVPFLERWAVQLPLTHNLSLRGQAEWPHLDGWYKAMEALPPYEDRVRQASHSPMCFPYATLPFFLCVTPHFSYHETFFAGAIGTRGPQPSEPSSGCLQTARSARLRTRQSRAPSMRPPKSSWTQRSCTRGTPPPIPMRRWPPPPNLCATARQVSRKSHTPIFAPPVTLPFLPICHTPIFPMCPAPPLPCFYPFHLQAVVADAVSSEPKTQRELKRLEADEAEAVELVLAECATRLLALAEAGGDADATAKTLRRSRSFLGGLEAPEAVSAARAAKYVAARLCAPRDLGASAAALLRATLRQVETEAERYAWSASGGLL